MDLLVEAFNDNGTAIGLTEDMIGTSARSRLRSARLYSEDRTETGGAGMYIRVSMYDFAFSMRLEYNKTVQDAATGLIYPVATWSTGGVGTHSERPDYILSRLGPAY